MVIVYHKGIFEKTFGSLTEAEHFVEECKDSGFYSRDDEDYSYSFY